MPCKHHLFVSIPLKLNFTKLFFHTVLGYYIVDTYKNLGESVEVLNNDSYLTLISSVSSLFNALRFVWSGALDKYSFKWVYGVLVVIQILLAATIQLTKTSKFSFAVMLCLTLFCIGGHFALFPNVLKQVFGKQATVLYGFLFTGTGLSSIFIVGLILTPVGKEYTVMFYIFGMFSVLSLIILIFFYKQTRFEPDWSAIFIPETNKSETGSRMSS